MDTIQTIVLALIQGITEFLPISSSAHLILPAQILAWPDQGIAFDVAVHVGSLIAVVTYFRQDIQNMIVAWLQSLRPQALSSGVIFSNNDLSAGNSANGSKVNLDDARLAWMVIAATLPAIIAALLCKDFIEAHLRSTTVIAVATIFFGLLLGLADIRSRRQSEVIKITWQIALLIGFAQVFALIPGTSRSGVTITAAVLLGLSKTDSARFSFLLSIPIITAAGAYAILEMVSEQPIFSWSQLALGVAVSAVSAYLCIGLFLKLLERIGFMPFVWYRLALGAILLAII